MTTTSTSTARVLTEEQRGVLGRALADAISYREPSGDCSGCQPGGRFCDPHRDDLGRADGYYLTAQALGLDLDQAEADTVPGTQEAGLTAHQIDEQYWPAAGEACTHPEHGVSSDAYRSGPDREAGQ